MNTLALIVILLQLALIYIVKTKAVPLIYEIEHPYDYFEEEMPCPYCWQKTFSWFLAILLYFIIIMILFLLISTGYFFYSVINLIITA